MTYAFLNFATDSDKGGFFARYQQEQSRIGEHLLFFELEFNKLTKTKQEELIALSPHYAFYLESLIEENPKKNKGALSLRTGFATTDSHHGRNFSTIL